MSRSAPARTRSETKRATRQALLEAGLAEFIEKGPDEPSLDAICARAGFTRGAFYVHFEDREQFFTAVMEWALGGILDSLIGAAESDEPLLPALTRYMQFAATGALPGATPRRLPIHRVLDAAVRFPTVRANFGRLVERVVERIAARLALAQERGEIRRDLDPEGTASLIALIGFGSLIVDAAGAPVDLPRILGAGLQALQPPGPQGPPDES
jgi:AcrR family transcriptional regulator